MTKFKKLASAAAVGLALSMTAGVAQAGVYVFQDDDVDAIFRPVDGNLGAPLQSGTLSVGDVFVSVLEIPTFSINGVPSIPAGQELTGVAAIELVNIIGAGVGAQYIFAPYSGGLNDVLALGGHPGITGGGEGEGAMIALWLNGAPGAGDDRNLILDVGLLGGATNCTDVGDCIDQASRGSLFQVDGFLGDLDEFWAATQITAGGGDIGTVLGTNNTVIVAGFNFALSNFFNSGGEVNFIDIATGTPCAGPVGPLDGCVQFTGSGTITGGQGLENGFIAHSDFDARKIVPEPGVLALLGAALLGFGARRKRNA
jgi:hypothetical protein